MAQLTGPALAFPIDSADRSTTAKVPLGTRAWTADGRQYVYVRAGADIAALKAVKFEGSAAGFDAVVPTAAATDFVIGAADGTAFTDLDYGFILTQGPTTVLATDSISAGVAVGASGTSGLLAVTTASTYANEAGVVLVAGGGTASSVGTTVYITGI